jgi:hypothetical protein
MTSTSRPEPTTRPAVYTEVAEQLGAHGIDAQAVDAGHCNWVVRVALAGRPWFELHFGREESERWAVNVWYGPPDETECIFGDQLTVPADAPVETVVAAIRRFLLEFSREVDDAVLAKVGEALLKRA